MGDAKPCPDCGPSHLSMGSGSKFDRFNEEERVCYSLKCLRCSRRGPSRSSPDEAREAWGAMIAKAEGGSDDQ